MNPGSVEISDKVTVLVFKDNFAARTFEIPLRWISRFGVILGILVSVSLLSTLVAVKYFRVASKADPTRVQDLEQELIELRTQLKQYETKGNTPALLSNPASSSSLPSAQVQPAVHVPSSTNAKLLSPAQVSNDKNLTVHSMPPLFAAFPTKFQTQLPDPALLPFSIQVPKATWRGKTLRLKFALQYTKNDQGTQQGRILILARGPGHLLAYPNRAFNLAGTEALINPDLGEPFSVSRYREVKAEFPVSSSNALKEVEILIFSKDSQPLLYQKIPVTPAAKAEAHTPPAEETASPSDASSSLTEPERLDTPIPTTPEEVAQ